MKRLLLTLVGLLATTFVWGESLLSPDGKFRLDFEVREGTPVYSLYFENQPVVMTSKMGLELDRGRSFTSGLQIRGSVTASVDTVWYPVLGQFEKVRDNYNLLSVQLGRLNGGQRMWIDFRLYDIGLAFRYRFDSESGMTYLRVQDECTEFAMTGDHKAFWIPGDFDQQEYYYATTPISGVNADILDTGGIGARCPIGKTSVQSPLMMKTADGLYLSLFEAAVHNYPVMHLLVDTDRYVFTSVLPSDASGTAKAFLQTPCSTPWRTVSASRNAGDILLSQLAYTLNEPCKIEDTSWIKPMKFVGVWWELHVPNRHSWDYSRARNIILENTDWNALTPHGMHGATTENVMHYIDFAAENGFDGVLVEGWNVGWEDWAGNWKEEVFDFVTPYPDFDLQKITDYAASKGVKMIMHHETSASATNYERRLDSAYNFMDKYGYKAVKTGYVGKIIPRGEHHDGQWMVNHYERVARKAAEHRVCVDSHEAARPSGQNRTYPNWMACESARGNEYNAWSVGNPPEHETILPFTRILGGGMDYTPGIFETRMDFYKEGNTCRVHTTLAKQLALYVTMYSPIQMAADIPENYEKYADAFQFIKDVDADWVDSRALEAEPGDYITIARKGKYKNGWFVGSITDENARTSRIAFDFLDPDKYYIATIYSDAPDADWDTNPKSYEIRRFAVTSKSKLKQYVAPGGGYAISISPASKAAVKGLKKL